MLRFHSDYLQSLAIVLLIASAIFILIILVIKIDINLSYAIGGSSAIHLIFISVASPFFFAVKEFS